MSTRRLVLQATASYPRLAELQEEIHEPRGVWNDEMAAVIAVSLVLGIDAFLESGRARGHSTRLLAKYLGISGVDIHSFDRARDADTAYAEEKLREYPNVHLHYGDSRRLLPALVRMPRRTAQKATMRYVIRIPASHLSCYVSAPQTRRTWSYR